MKKFLLKNWDAILAVVITVALVLPVMGCAELSGRLGKAPVPGGLIDQQTVVAMVCRGLDPSQYIVDAGGKSTDINERSARALKEIQVGQINNNPLYARCCAQTPCATSPYALSLAVASPAPSPSPTPSPK